MSDILAEMRGVLAGHAEECGARADQMMIDGRLYPDEIEDWAREVARLQHIEAAARAHMQARDAYYHHFARHSGWHEGRLLDDGSAARQTWGELRAALHDVGAG